MTKKRSLPEGEEEEKEDQTTTTTTSTTTTTTTTTTATITTPPTSATTTTTTTTASASTSSSNNGKSGGNYVSMKGNIKDKWVKHAGSYAVTSEPKVSRSDSSSSGIGSSSRTMMVMK